VGRTCFRRCCCGLARPRCFCFSLHARPSGPDGKTHFHLRTLQRRFVMCLVRNSPTKHSRARTLFSCCCSPHGESTLHAEGATLVWLNLAPGLVQASADSAFAGVIFLEVSVRVRLLLLSGAGGNVRSGLLPWGAVEATFSTIRGCSGVVSGGDFLHAEHLC
jgi:hypothetical protein